MSAGQSNPLALEARVKLWLALLGIYGEMDGSSAPLVAWADDWIASGEPVDPLVELSLESRILADTLYPLRCLSGSVDVRDALPSFAQVFLPLLRSNPAHTRWYALDALLDEEDFPAEYRTQLTELDELAILVHGGGPMTEHQHHWFNRAFRTGELIADEEIYWRLLTVLLEKWSAQSSGALIQQSGTEAREDL